MVTANPSTAAVIPLTSDELVMGAPCQMLYVADVVWPAKRATDSPVVNPRSLSAGNLLRARFGWRAQGNLTACTPDTDFSSGALPAPWYGKEPP